MAQDPETSLIEHHITVAARPEVVFSYFTDPTKMVRWMGSEATLDPQPGGICRIVFRPSAARLEFVMSAYGIGEAQPGGPGEARVMLGKFVEVDPYRRIALTWGWEQELFTVPRASTAVEVLFEPEADRTLVRVAHRRLPGPAIEFHRGGWQHYLARLATTAAGGDPGPDPWGSDRG